MFISVQAFQKAVPACGVSRKVFSNLSVMVPCRHFLAYMQVMEMTLLKPHFVDFCNLFQSHDDCG